MMIKRKRIGIVVRQEIYRKRMVEEIGKNVKMVLMGVLGVGELIEGIEGQVEGELYKKKKKMEMEMGVMVLVVVVVGGIGQIGGEMFDQIMIGII